MFFYLGIDTCLPEIERQRRSAFYHYETEELSDRISKKIIKKASYILNKDYDALTQHKAGKRAFYGVQTSSGLTYSSLSMGTGEQRVIRILDVLFRAPNYSMILIDELDLLLHNNAIRRLIEIINQEAINKKLQVIFTTHSLLMNEISEIDIRYIEPTPGQTLVFDSINTGMIYSMTGEQNKPIQIFVEDAYAQAVVRDIAKDLGLLSKVKIGTYGAAHNSFALAASYVLKGENSENVLIVIDGDEYRTDDEQRDQINKCISGTEDDIGDRQARAHSLITQFNLPTGITPEKFLHDLMMTLGDDENEIVSIAREIRGVDDAHRYVLEIVKRIDYSYDVVMKDILDVVSWSNEWSDYTNSIRQWLGERAEI